MRGLQQTATTTQGELVFGMMANLAQFESALIGERVAWRASAERSRVIRWPAWDDIRDRQPIRP
jgi:DNA invertase Pin-like site-specific DNA recombinase